MDRILQNSLSDGSYNPAADILDKETSTTLKESEEKYRTLIETSPDAIIMLDMDMHINMCNRQFLYLTAYEDIDQILNTNFSDYLLKKQHSSFYDDAEEVMKSGTARNLHYTLKSITGKRIPVEINSSLVLDSLGKPSGIICNIRDITQRKITERALLSSELRFRSVWENSNDGMRLTDENGIIIEVNRAYCELTGMHRDELVGKYFFEIYADEKELNKYDLLEFYKEGFRKRTLNKYLTSKCKFRKEEIVELNETYSFIELRKNYTLLLGIFHNVTEMRKAEVALRSSQKFAEIGKQAAILTHEIKTPLASIKTNIDMLNLDLAIPESNQRSLKIIQKEIKRLVKLLKNVLQYSRETEMLFIPVDLASVFDNIIDFMRPLAEENNAVLINNVRDFKILGDYKNLQTVFMHLIENSFESITSNGIIELYCEKKDDFDSIYIKDNGCGIEDKEKIFQPFYTTKSTGTGLGLTIALNILKQHNAELSLLKSEPGETIFEIKFKKNQE